MGAVIFHDFSLLGVVKVIKWWFIGNVIAIIIMYMAEVYLRLLRTHADGY